MKKILLISTLLISLSSISYSDNHYPITRDSELMIASGKIAYRNNCASCCLLYTSDAPDDSLRVDLGGRRTIKNL